MSADELMYWVSINNPALKMAFLNGTGEVTLLDEPKADYTGITLYNNCLYISDSSRRSVFYITSLIVTQTRRPVAGYHNSLLKLIMLIMLITRCYA